ncbi:putative hsp70 protein [Botrytis fragariae]|uniref:Putative hsp70 protein n=1 Tax=Botrytis fragariae TaxID=1964551 RepID=A0A8H6ARA0_9HELO|nr:putative hsp70 protein [Botrytis fragariae]KAF5872053.1 putative hsp70 protein [Botrytis fragariae]
MDDRIKQDKPAGGVIPHPSDQLTFESEDQIVIAMDFGTTFTGVAYAFLNDENPRVVGVDIWPGLTERQPKIPTILSYNESGAMVTWGAQAQHGRMIRGIKLLLDPTQAMPSYVPAWILKRNLERLGRPSVDVAADFIRAIYEYVMGIAARKASFYPVTLVKEPEAAALYALTEFKERGLANGDAFVICDAGGGTVDLISYEIVQLDPRLELKELVPGAGFMAGSLNLNNRFEEKVKELVGEAQFNDPENSSGFRAALKQFDTSVKLGFLGIGDEVNHLHFLGAKLKDDQQKGLENACWTIKSAELKDIFDPIIADIKTKVHEQVQEVKKKRLSENHPKADKVKAILLVGGFCSSNYLKSQLVQDHPAIQVIQPHGAWSAIVKGAVLTRLPQKVMVVSTQATRHYGVSAHHTYDYVEDIGYPKFLNAYGKWKTSRMTWYIQRGEDLQRPQKIHFSFYRVLHSLSDETLMFKENLHHCELVSAPVRPDPTVAINCSLQVDLRGVDRTTIRKRIDRFGDQCWDVYFDLVVTVDSAIMMFSLEYNGEEMGSVKAKYD